MFGLTESLSQDLREDAHSLEISCQRRWGVTGRMFRTAKFIFYIAVLAFSAFIIESTTVDATFVLFFAALLISGPEGVEALLIREGVIEETKTEDK